ncbi:MAG: DUF3221 domain-containing protein [Firmicutes bacterium]|nr:DUF3221 domain-containing protein [Bacillota bacterium]
MKKLLVLVIISSLMFSFGCSAKSEIKFGEGNILKTSASGKGVLVDGKFEGYSQKNRRFYFLIDNNTEFVNEDGESSTYGSLKTGQYIEVWTEQDSPIQESYPPRITASKIIIKNETSEPLDRKGLKEFYIQGSYDGELYKKQMAKEGKIYYTVVNNTEELNEQINKYSLRTPRQEYSLNYNSEFFNNKAIVLVYPTQGSSSLSFWVKDITKDDGMINISIEKYTPEAGTTDIVLHGLLIEMYKNDYSSSESFKIQIKEATPPEK